MKPSPSEKIFSIRHVAGDESEQRDDFLAVEEPMEIRVVFGPQEQRKGKSLSITMRTPGSDFELAAGFLFSEGVINSQHHVVSFEFCGRVSDDAPDGNTVRVNLHPELDFDPQRFQRHFYTTSSCGVCGKASLDAIRNLNIEPVPNSGMTMSAATIGALPSQLRKQQASFAKTGGIHAAGLFDQNGDLLLVREDVGRHNALDKLIGRELLDGHRPLTSRLIVLSGRASFELVQKTVAAGAEILVAVGAPSSLAVELAREFNVTLVGFASPERLNVYSGEERIK